MASPITPAPEPRAAAARRPYGTLVVGLVLLAGCVAWTVLVDYPTGLGTMFGLLLGYVLAAYYVVDGVRRLHQGPDEADDDAPPAADGDSTWTSPAGRRSWRCTLLGHRERFVARDADHPPVWECRRCGAQSRTHLSTGMAWLCRLPFVEHRYDYVGRTDAHPEFWRCRRCRKRRYTRPRTAGETLEAVSVDKLWVRKGHE